MSGHTTVGVAVEVIAENEKEAIKKASKSRYALEEYCGNGGYDKIVGVDGENESVSSEECIEYDYADDLGEFGPEELEEFYDEKCDYCCEECEIIEFCERREHIDDEEEDDE